MESLRLPVEEDGVGGESGSGLGMESGKVQHEQEVPSSSSSTCFCKRFLLFKNSLVVGIFPGETPTDSTDRKGGPEKFIMLSPNGEFSHISSGNVERTHLTRYVPTNFVLVRRHR